MIDQFSSIGMFRYLVILTIISIKYSVVECCFIVHYVLYFNEIPMTYYLQMSQNSSFPYIVHLNQPLELPNNRTFHRQITPVEKSDIKKVQVIYHHGGLYIDSDQFIDYQCNKKQICKLKGTYFLDWTHLRRWKQSVPLSWIYSSDPGNKTLLKSLIQLNQSKQGIKGKGPRTVFFSGPSHIQQYRKNISFVKIPKNCQFHRADQSWVDKNNNQIKYIQKVRNILLNKFSSKQKSYRSKFTQLWLTHTAIYPKNFDINTLKTMSLDFNHIEMEDPTQCKIKSVIQYSNIKENINLLNKFIMEYQPQLLNQTTNNTLGQYQMQQIVKQIPKLQHNNSIQNKTINISTSSHNQSNSMITINISQLSNKINVIDKKDIIEKTDKTNKTDSIDKQNKINETNILIIDKQKKINKQDKTDVINKTDLINKTDAKDKTDIKDMKDIKDNTNGIDKQNNINETVTIDKQRQINKQNKTATEDKTDIKDIKDIKDVKYIKDNTNRTNIIDKQNKKINETDIIDKQLKINKQDKATAEDKADIKNIIDNTNEVDQLNQMKKEDKKDQKDENLATKIMNSSTDQNLSKQNAHKTKVTVLQAKTNYFLDIILLIIFTLLALVYFFPKKKQYQQCNNKEQLIKNKSGSEQIVENNSIECEKQKVQIHSQSEDQE